MVEKKTTFTESIPAEETQPGKKPRRPPLFDFLPTLSAQDWKEKEFALYLYRYDRVTGERNALEKFNEVIDPFIIKRLYGGGKFNLLMKEGPELIYNIDFGCEGEEITPAHIPVAAAPTDGNSAVTLEALRMMSNPEIMRMQMDMFRTAATEAMAMIKAQIPAAQNPLETLRAAKEILGVGTQPQNNLLETIRTLKELGLIRGENNSVSETIKVLGELRGAGLVGGEAKGDVMSTLAANALPIIDRIAGGFRDYRLSQEATVRALEIQRGIAPGDGRVINVEPGQAGASSTESAPTAPADGVRIFTAEEMRAMVLLRLEVLINTPQSTGEDVYDFLRVNAPEWIPQLAPLTREQILTGVFPMDPILKRCLGNPRLPQLIDEFLVAVKEDTEPAVPTKLT